MSNKIVNEIRKLPIDSTPKMLLWVISDIADDEGNTSWYAPRSRLMEETGYSNRTIASCISYLKKCGVLRVTGGNGHQNHYTVTPENFDPSIKYESKKDLKPVNLAQKPVSEVHYPTSERGSLPPVNLAHKPVNLAQKPVSEVHTIHHIPIYPSIYPSLGDSDDSPKNRPKRITKKQVGVNRLVELGCEKKYAHDWMVARRGAELTESIIENLTEQARKANIPISTAVEWSAKKGYQGFKADWYLKDQQPQQSWTGGYQSSAQQTANEQAKWDNFLKGENQFRDVSPKKNPVIEGVGHA